MRKIIAAALSVFFIAESCIAAEKIENKDKFEQDYVSCISTGAKNGCWSEVFSNHFAPWVTSKDESLLLSNTQSFFDKWIGNKSIYKVHVVGSNNVADVFDTRVYLVELSTGELAALQVTYRKMKGDWYVFGIEGGTSDGFIRSALNMPRLPSSK